MKKTFLALIVGLGVLSIILPAHSELRLESLTSLELYKKNDLIVIGNIISSIEDEQARSTEYLVQIKEYLKNPNGDDTITVLGSGIKNFQSSIDKIFVVGDTVLLFLTDSNGVLTISPYSKKITDDPSTMFFRIPPLKLYKLDIPFEEIFCSPGLVLIQKMTDDKPACVKPSSVEELLLRGWGKT